MIDIERLNTELLEHNERYYKHDAPIISDERYDKLLTDLRNEVERTGKRPKNYVLDKVGNDISGHLKEVKHIRPMISIRTEVDTSEKPISDFIARCKKVFPDKAIAYVAEPKYDGLAISLRYDEQGVLKMAVTRGDGVKGDDITHNVVHVLNIPCQLPQRERYDEVRGELLLLKDNFDKANAIRISNNDKPFINCRNAIAGIIRKKHPDVELLKLAFFIPYSCFGESASDSQTENLVNLKRIFGGRQRIERNAGDKLYGSGLYGAYLQLQRHREELPFEIDGVVYKVDSITDQEKMGISGREPRWAIAHKLPAEVAETVLQDIDVQVGPSGRLTPVARVDPIFVGGTTVSNVTLSNIFRIREKGLRKGDIIKLQRAGDVIPEIIGVSSNNHRSEYVPNFRMPKFCPICDGEVQRKKGESNHYCINTFMCPAQSAGRLIKVCSKAILDIDGFGDKIAENLVREYKTEVYQLFELTLEDLTDACESEVNARKLLVQFERAKITPIGFDMFLRMLCIPDLGASASKKIAAYIGNFIDFVKFNPDELKPFGVNSRVMESIKGFQKSSVAVEMAFRLIRKLNVVNYEKNVDGVLSGKTLVLTGSAPDISRTGLSKKIEELGGKTSDSVSKATSYVVYGEGAGSKLAKAQTLGIQTMTYEDFMKEFKISL